VNQGTLTGVTMRQLMNECEGRAGHVDEPQSAVEMESGEYCEQGEVRVDEQEQQRQSSVSISD
jgi:hypothetical protein